MLSNLRVPKDANCSGHIDEHGAAYDCCDWRAGGGRARAKLRGQHMGRLSARAQGLAAPDLEFTSSPCGDGYACSGVLHRFDEIRQGGAKLVRQSQIELDLFRVIRDGYWPHLNEFS
jgi:hypothetical protein